MFAIFKKIFNLNAATEFKELADNGAIILDVRTKGEFEEGHIFGAINIPVDQLEKNLHLIDNSNSIITCCASGMRSAAAKSLLSAKGYKAVYNGGGWKELQKKIKI